MSNWKEKLAILWRGGIRIQSGLQPYPPKDLRNPALGERKINNVQN